MTHFHASHHLVAGVEAVMETMVDPRFYAGLELPDVAEAEILGHEEDGERRAIELRYRFTGRVDPIVRRLVGNAPLTWRQHLEIDLARCSGTLIVASEGPRRLRGDAEITFRSDGAGTDREIDGNLTVSVPLVRAAAERSIISGFLERLDVEAEAINARVGPTGPPPG